MSLAGAPLKKATARLEAASQMNQSNFANYAAPTDGGGKFVFEDVTPGTYILSAERTGYLRRYYGARSTTAGATQIKLDGGQGMKDVVIKLTPQGMIFGKVVDEDGDPISGASVSAWRWIFRNGRKHLMSFAEQNSQADGTFVIGDLSQGTYYVSAERQSNFSSEKVADLKTYFPNAPDTVSAAPVNVSDGAEVKGIEIHLRRGRVFEIRGKLESVLGGTVLSVANVDLIAKETGDHLGTAQMDRDAKSFQFKHVAPGGYLIETRATEAGAPAATGFPKLTELVARFEVTVADKDLENVVVPLIPGAEIRGIFKTDGEVPKAVVQLRDSRGYQGANAEAQRDGRFRMEGISPDVARVNVYGLPGNMYVKTITFDGRDVNGKDLDLTSGNGGEMEIVLSPDGTEVTGMVRDSDGNAVPGAVVQICGKDDAGGRFALSDQHGAYDFKGLVPGDYKVFAWEDEGDGIVSVVEFRKSFESKAAALTLEEKSHQSIDLALISKDAMDVEAAKIR